MIGKRSAPDSRSSFVEGLADKVSIAVVVSAVLVRHGFKVGIHLAVLMRFGAAFSESDDDAVFALNGGADGALKLQEVD